MIGILNAYHFDFTPGNYQEQYNKVLDAFLARAFASEKVRHYKIASPVENGSIYGCGEWPLSFDECTTWIITGSSKSAYDDVAWVNGLQDWIRGFHEYTLGRNSLARKSTLGFENDAGLRSAITPKLIGICFGHQIIAQALGGLVEKSPKGWGVGVKTFHVIQKQLWMKPPQSKISIIFSHQDQVVKLPPGAVLLATDDFCPNQMFQLGENILTMQGHPEFSEEFAKSRLDTRKKIIAPEALKRAMDSFETVAFRDDKLVGQWLREFSKAQL